jgi:hypothetical protein
MFFSCMAGPGHLWDCCNRLWHITQQQQELWSATVAATVALTMAAQAAALAAALAMEATLAAALTKATALAETAAAAVAGVKQCNPQGSPTSNAGGQKWTSNSTRNPCQSSMATQATAQRLREVCSSRSSAPDSFSPNRRQSSCWKCCSSTQLTWTTPG